MVIGSQDRDSLIHEMIRNLKGGGFNFSLFYFGGGKDTNDKYKVLLSGAKYDENGLFGLQNDTLGVRWKLPESLRYRSARGNYENIHIRASCVASLQSL